MATWTIGDIHGYSLTLKKLLDKINPASGDTIITLGDYINRGPDSRGVIEVLLELAASGVILKPLAGNHEAMLLAAYGWFDALPPGFISRNEDVPEWLQLGSKHDVTFESYGWKPVAHYGDNLPGLPETHERFFRNLLTHQLLDFAGEKFLCVHAGLHLRALEQPTIEQACDLAQYISPRQMLWERRTLLVEPGFQGTIVHGHTPWPALSLVCDHTKFPTLPARAFGKINLDSGIADIAGIHLTAAKLPEVEFAQMERVN